MFLFSLQLLSETFLILRRIERDMIKDVHWYSCIVPDIFCQIFKKFGGGGRKFFLQAIFEPRNAQSQPSHKSTFRKSYRPPTQWTILCLQCHTANQTHKGKYCAASMRSAADNHLLQLDYNGLTRVTVIQNASLRSGISKRGTDNCTPFRTQQRKGNL